jgi:hypothetical protein
MAQKLITGLIKNLACLIQDGRDRHGLSYLRTR